MVRGAIVHCRIRRVIFGVGDPKGGAAGGLLNLLQQPTLNHRSEITPECSRRSPSPFSSPSSAPRARRRRKSGTRIRRLTDSTRRDLFGDLGQFVAKGERP